MDLSKELPDFVVQQRNPQSGCIPSGYEMLLRAGNVAGIGFESFQEDFDLGIERNDFGSVAHAIMEGYPDVHLAHKPFDRGDGKRKLEFIEEFSNRGQPVLMSLYLMPFFGANACHIMLVVNSDEQNITLLHRLDENNVAHFLTLPKSELVRIHDQYDYGNDVAFLEIE